MTLVLIIVITGGYVTGLGQVFLVILTLFFAVMTSLVSYNAGQGDLAPNALKLRPDVIYETIASRPVHYPTEDEDFHRYAVYVRSVETRPRYLLITASRNPPGKHFRMSEEDFVPVSDPNNAKS
jgi:hypothetical protein